MFYCELGTWGVIEEDGTEKLFKYDISNEDYHFRINYENKTEIETSWGIDEGVIVPKGTIKYLLNSKEELIKQKMYFIC